MGFPEPTLPVPDYDDPPSDPSDLVPGSQTDWGGPTGPSGDSHPASQYRSIVVEYPDGNDRLTVVPHALTHEELMVTWLTADAAAFIDLWAAR